MDNLFRKVSRGQVWYLVDEHVPAIHTQGSVQGKNRPWLIVSNNNCNQFSPIYTVVPLTTAAKTSLPTHVTFKTGDKEQTILCEQLRTVPQQVFYNNGSTYKWTMSEDAMKLVDEALAVQLGLQIVFPNSDRYWESLERLIRAQVRKAVEATKVSAIDINAMANLLNDKVESIVQEETSPQPKPAISIVEENVTEPVETKQEDKGWVPCKRTKPRNDWTKEKMEEFLEDCSKFGVRTVAEKYKLSIQTVYVNKAKFKKELGDGTDTERQVDN